VGERIPQTTPDQGSPIVHGACEHTACTGVHSPTSPGLAVQLRAGSCPSLGLRHQLVLYKTRVDTLGVTRGACWVNQGTHPALSIICCYHLMIMTTARAY
jgi:hypothetical protein